MMVLCKSHCIHNKNNYCTRDIIRLDSSGTCEQCIFEDDFDIVPLTREVKQVMMKGKKCKAARKGKSLIQ